MVFAIKKIALDSSVILSQPKIAQKIRNVFGNRVEIVVPSQVVLELRTLAGQKQAWKKKWTIWETEQKNLQVQEKKVLARNADQALQRLAEQGFVIATLDKKLAKKIKENNQQTLFIQGTKFENIREE